MHVDSLAKIRADIINDRDLPTVPVVVTRILALTESESSSPRELIDLIEVDQVLTARILRIANSPFFGLSRQASSLQRALMVLGYDSVRDLALGVKVWDAFVDRGGRAVLRLWQHATSVAISARSIARELGRVDAGTAFTCGLLHDIGRAALHLHAPETMAQLALGPGEESLAIEREVLGVDHAAVGAWMAESWNLPPVLVEAIQHHHEPRPDALPPASLATLIGLADELARRIERCAAAASEPPLSTDDCDILGATAGIEPGAWPEIADGVRHQSADLAALFGRHS
jgi:putative nucleotidyltransferase with HDIG domain